MADPIIPATPSDEAYAMDADQGDVFTINDPFALFADWLVLAGKTEPNDPNAMALATVDKTGLPDVRMVLLKDVSVCGLTFYTNTQSAKGQQLAGQARAALCFHWKTIRRQVRFRGTIEPVNAKDADAYFAERSRGAQIGAHASAQSKPLDERATFEKEIASFEKKYEGQDVPRPDYWSGFRLIPTEIEFWVNRPFRLHDRLQFTRADAQAPWEKGFLYP